MKKKIDKLLNEIENIMYEYEYSVRTPVEKVVNKVKEIRELIKEKDEEHSKNIMKGVEP